MEEKNRGDVRERWARLRFAVIAPLLASPPARGELQEELEKLSQKHWQDPSGGTRLSFSVSTIERWYSRARKAETDPVGALARAVRKDAGRQSSVSSALAAALAAQHRSHSSWSYKLHADNLVALAKQHPELGPVPSVASVRRFMKAHGLFRTKRRGSRQTEGTARAEQRFEQLEVRRFEAEYVNGLWHMDFHHGSRRVLTSSGRWEKPILFAALDDRSRLCCHAQWYLSETAETLVHGLVQAFQKRGLPRSLMWDNGAAMRAEEVLEGLRDLGVEVCPTLPYSPYQNGKQESFWSVVEGRLVAMLEGEHELALTALNEATQAWLEADYNRREHSQIGATPLARFLAGPDVVRECPVPLELRRAFRLLATRTQRRSDGTLSIEGERFEVPSRFGHLERICVRYARWDLSLVEMIDPKSRVVLARLLPVDLARNAEGLRKARELPSLAHTAELETKSGIAPLLSRMIEERRASGLPPAYLPGRDEKRAQGETSEEVAS